MKVLRTRFYSVSPLQRYNHLVERKEINRDERQLRALNILDRVWKDHEAEKDVPLKEVGRNNCLVVR